MSGIKKCHMQYSNTHTVISGQFAQFHFDALQKHSEVSSFLSCENPDDIYVTVFHPVVSDSRVLVPSHIKRFSMNMFTFTKDKAVLKDLVR